MSFIPVPHRQFSGYNGTGFQTNSTRNDEEPEKIDGSEDAWDERHLGADEEFVSVAEADDSGIDAALDLQMISIRL